MIDLETEIKFIRKELLNILNKSTECEKKLHDLRKKNISLRKENKELKDKLKEIKDQFYRNELNDDDIKEILSINYEDY